MGPGSRPRRKDVSVVVARPMAIGDDPTVLVELIVIVTGIEFSVPFVPIWWHLLLGVGLPPVAVEVFSKQHGSAAASFEPSRDG
jgi:hypothetical protein